MNEPIIQRVQNVARTAHHVIPPQGEITIQQSWPNAVLFVEFQPSPGSRVDFLKIGSLPFDQYHSAEGKRIEANQPIEVKIVNPNIVTIDFQGLFFTEELEPLPAAASLPEIPAVPEVHNAAAPRGPVPSVTTQVMGQPTAIPPPRTGGFSQTGVPDVQQVGQQVPYQAQVVGHQGPPPARDRVVLQPMPPGLVVSPQQYATAASIPAGMQQGYGHGQAPVMAQQHTPDGTQGVQQQFQGGYQQVGGPGQQFIHVGGGITTDTSQSQQVRSGPGEIVLLLTEERCRKVAFVLRGGVVMPQEVPAVCTPIEYAITNQPMTGGVTATAGANERVVVISRGQAERIMAMLKGTDWHDMEALANKFVKR